jgi:aminopeptidase N
MRHAFAVSVVVLLCLIDGEARQSSVQTFDQPIAGARSPRNANYQIDVRLDHAARTLTARETIRWRNISGNAATELQFHLYWNAWRDLESTFMRERQFAAGFTPPRNDAWGSVEVRRITVAGADLTTRQRFLSPDDGNSADRTVMAVTLPTPVQPQQTVEITVEWTSKIPRPFARTGYVGNYYFIAQWFPKLGVLEDRGWNTHQFHASTEFYSDYGVYDVRIIVPAGFVVGASGRETERTANADGTETHRYVGEDIHDFAWTASPDYLDSVQMFEHPSLPPVRMRLLLQPEHASQASRHFEATAAALKHYGEFFGPYSYDYITIIDPAYQSGAGGMEYPTLFTAGARWLAPARIAVPQRVTIHEAGHQWWYGIVGSNEFEHAWLDEGLNTYSEARTMEAAAFPNYVGLRFFGGFVPWVIDDIQMVRATDLNRLTGYRNNAETDTPASPTYRYWPSTATFITYNKTALWLHTLERRLGWPRVQQVMSTYWDRWKFRHPQPDDFFAVVNELSGEDLTWFFDQVYRSSNVFDYGVQEFTSRQVRLNLDTATTLYRTVVVAGRFGEAVYPVDVVTTFRNGEKVTERWDGRDRRAIYIYDRPSQARSVQVDPSRQLLLDVNYTNNSATLEPRASDASLKWTLAWLTWLQDLMLTYAFFV